jgi:hypothetical protein
LDKKATMLWLTKTHLRRTSEVAVVKTADFSNCADGSVRGRLDGALSGASFFNERCVLDRW